jgi:AcrR family transcriptional regulator
MNHENIAKVMGISVTALTNHYREELDIGLSVVMDDVKTNLYNIARDPAHKGTVQAGIYLLSRLGGDAFKDIKRIEMTGADGKALEVSHQTQTVDPRLLDADQREALRDILTSALRLAAPNAQAQSNVIDGEYEEVDNA